MVNFSQVTDNLFIGDCFAADDHALLKKHEITHVVCALKLLKPNYAEGITPLYIEVNDSSDEDLGQHFEEIYEFMDNAIENETGKVYVHCAAGVSRSSTCLISYLMKKKNWKFAKTKHFVTQRHITTYPNEGFTKQLLEWEKKLEL